MTNWKLYKIKDLGRVVTGKTPASKFPHYFGSESPFITPSDFKSYIKNADKADRYISQEGSLALKNNILPERSVLVTCIGSDMGKVVMNSKICLTNQQINSIIPNLEVIDSDFLYYSLVSQYSLLRSMGSDGTTMPIVNKTDFENITLLIPDLLTQRRIAEILSALDDKIDLNRRMNQTLEQMAQTLYEKYSEVDELVPLTDLVELNPKLTLKKGTVSQYVEMSNLSETSASIKQSVLREYSGGAKFQNNDTLLARITPCLENGKTGFVNILGETEVGFGSTEYIVMRAKQSISPYFVYCVARDKAFREHAMRSMTGTSGRQRVQTDMLETYDLPKWSFESMTAFHTSAHAAFQKIKANSAEINTLTTLRDTLLPKLMSGEIDVMQTQAEDMHEPILS